MNEKEKAIRAAARAREHAAQAHLDYLAAIRAAKEAGATGVEIGEALGLTKQRVGQLLKAEAEAAGRMAGADV